MLRLLSTALAFLTSLTGTHAAHHAVTHPAHPAVKRVVVAAKPVSRPRPALPVYGGDVSWPNCPTNVGIPGRHGYDLPMPTSKARFVVLGATNGPAFTHNPCLLTQRLWASARHLPMAAYAVIHYPTSKELARYGGRGTLSQKLQRTGAAEARHALAVLRRAHVPTPIVWVDVETVGHHPWSSRAWRNVAVLRGVFAQYRRSHVRYGLYSYKYAWQHIMGGVRIPTVLTWVPSGGTTRTDGLHKCRTASFSRGRVAMTQWTAGRRDHNTTCPGIRASGLVRKA